MNRLRKLLPYWWENKGIQSLQTGGSEIKFVPAEGEGS
jgi:hypothetical protein